jgi:hypothetical protein
MKAKFIYEAFTEKSDPIKDMGIGSIALFKKQLEKDANDPDDIEYAYGETIRKFRRKYPDTDWVKIFNKLSDNIYVNEAFTEDESDPIADMGIGGFSYETLSPGAILVPKRLGIAVTKNQSGQFTSWHTGLKLTPNSFILVTSINKYGDNYKDIRFKKYGWRDGGGWDNYSKEIVYEAVESARKEIKQGKGIWTGTAGRMIVSKKKFDYRFDVIEKGF